MIGNISSIALSLPKKKVLIKDICLEKNWSYKKILDKTGIKAVYKSNPNETALSMAIKAAKKIKFKKSEIDALVYVTQSPEFLLPTNACLIQNHIKLNKDIIAFDVNLGCSGFLYALRLATSLIESKQIKNGLIICADTYTKYISKTNTACRPIFSDAAAATLVSTNSSNKIGPFELGADGTGADALELPMGSNEIIMHGAKVLTFAMDIVPKNVNQL